ncbi:MAG: 3-hydroxybutyryl-CoA dehydrogenase [Anaerolineaceae bacterium]|nr:3-hydroxybutyryl-CoA dehydrogenase [Anaerolineaceae bacterium]
MKVVIAGESPFVEQMGQLCTQADHDAILYLVEDFTSALHSGYAMPDAAGADVAIELHNESAAAKEELLAALSAFIPSDALLLTSALATSTTQAAAWVPKPGRVVGFGIVPPLRKEGGMIELAAGLQTAAASLAQAQKFVEGLGYETAVVADGPGLVRARTVCCLINEAASALLEGVATATDIDQAMKLGTNYPYGPLEWADYLGLDTVLGVMNGLFSEWGEDRYRPSPLLKRMVLAGKYGRKSGEGFFKYES